MYNSSRIVLKDERILIIAKLGYEAYSLLAKLASRHDNIIWISSNPTIPSKILKAYSLDAKLFGFYSKIGQVVNPLRLDEIGLTILRSEEAGESCVIISCISELIMYHDVRKVYHFLLNVIKNTRYLLGMLIDGAQEKRDEILISTLFDAVFKLERRSIGEITLIPEVYDRKKVYKFRYHNGIVMPVNRNNLYTN